ncbi:MAG: hypothetical protein E7201_07870 [Selenomonas ruminantium]|uniref:Uncharacterized protein n=1 Tax=Selenomonas ruminantium TaxID=971 RepID=A0A927WRA1_SELRU|nr:hypothetical protein [Selenomonas ruminantium]
MYKKYDELPEDIRKFISLFCLEHDRRAKYAPRVVFAQYDDVVFYELKYLQYNGYCCEGIGFKTWAYGLDGERLDWHDENHREKIYWAAKKLEAMNIEERVKSSVVVPHIKPIFL